MTIVRGPSDGLVVVGSQFTFTCITNTSIVMRWDLTRDGNLDVIYTGSKLSSRYGARFNVGNHSSKDTYYHLLTIPSVQLVDAGTYSCRELTSPTKHDAVLTVLG